MDAVTRVVTTIAGTGTEGDRGDGGPATHANIVLTGIAVDSSGHRDDGGRARVGRRRH